MKNAVIHDHFITYLSTIDSDLHFSKLGNTCVMLLRDSNFKKFIDYKINTGYKIESTTRLKE